MPGGAPEGAPGSSSDEPGPALGALSVPERRGGVWPGLGEHSYLALCLPAPWCGLVFCVSDAVARLGALVSSPEARSEDNVGSSDNAVSALGKLCEFQGEGAGFDTAQVLHAWLHYLPVRDDKTEAKSVHAHLARLLQR